MTAAIALHFLFGIAFLIGGASLLRRGQRVLGWMLSALGTAVTAMGIIAPTVHRHLH